MSEIGIYAVKRPERKMIKVLFLLIYLGIISVEDYRYRSLSLWELIVGAVLALVISFFLGESAGICILKKIILSMGFLSIMAFFRESLGLGDAVVFDILWILLGVGETIRIIFLASVLFLLVLGLFYYRKRCRDSLPFIPFIAGGYILELVFKSIGKGG